VQMKAPFLMTHFVASSPSPEAPRCEASMARACMPRQRARCSRRRGRGRWSLRGSASP
jgi:hypothetical protein